MKNCPVCQSRDLIPFLAQKGVPVHQHLVFKSKEEARRIRKGDLAMTACRDCSFVFNATFAPDLVTYDQTYDNTQTHSSHFAAYLDDLIKILIEEKGAKNAIIVEVGCGKGDFLKKLIDYPHANNKGYGFDPSYVGPEIERDGRLVFEKRFYDENCAAIDADIVVCRHVIEHIPSPYDILKPVAAGLKNSPQAKVFFETPDVSWIFKNHVIWDFFYEHCSLYTPASITRALESCGFDTTAVGTVFQEQYLWAESTPAKGAARSQNAPAPGFAQSVESYKAAYTAHLAELKTTLEKLKTKGPIALWGAGAKGVTVCNIADQEASLIDAVIDMNPNKQGGFIAGTGQCIIGPEDIAERGITSALVMNPNYRREIETLLQEKNIKLNLVNWD